MSVPHSGLDILKRKVSTAAVGATGWCGEGFCSKLQWQLFNKFKQLKVFSEVKRNRRCFVAKLLLVVDINGCIKLKWRRRWVELGFGVGLTM